MSIALELIYYHKPVCWGKSEHWCLEASNSITSFLEKHVVLFDDDVACDIQNSKHCTAITIKEFQV